MTSPLDDFTDLNFGMDVKYFEDSDLDDDLNSKRGSTQLKTTCSSSSVSAKSLKPSSVSSTLSSQKNQVSMHYLNQHKDYRGFGSFFGSSQTKSKKIVKTTQHHAKKNSSSPPNSLESSYSNLLLLENKSRQSKKKNSSNSSSYSSSSNDKKTPIHRKKRRKSSSHRHKKKKHYKSKSKPKNTSPSSRTGSYISHEEEEAATEQANCNNVEMVQKSIEQQILKQKEKLKWLEMQKERYFEMATKDDGLPCDEEQDNYYFRALKNHIQKTEISIDHTDDTEDDSKKSCSFEMRVDLISPMTKYRDEYNNYNITNNININNNFPQFLHDSKNTDRKQQLLPRDLSLPTKKKSEEKKNQQEQEQEQEVLFWNPQTHKHVKLQKSEMQRLQQVNPSSVCNYKLDSWELYQKLQMYNNARCADEATHHKYVSRLPPPAFSVL